MDGLHGEGMTQHEGNPLLGTEISEPVPGEDTFDRHHEAVPIGRHGLEKRFRCGFHVTVHQDFPILVHHTDVHAPGMQVDTAVIRMGLCVKSHWGLLLAIVVLVHNWMTAYGCQARGGEGASMSINSLQPTGYAGS